MPSVLKVSSCKITRGVDADSIVKCPRRPLLTDAVSMDRGQFPCSWTITQLVSLHICAVSEYLGSGGGVGNAVQCSQHLIDMATS